MSVRAGIAESKPPIRCLVVQLARLGDTIQSLMALKAAKELYPELSITLVVREKFSAAAKRVSFLTEVISLPEDEILAPLNEVPTNRPKAYKDLARWAGQIIARPWDLAVNWTYSEASSYLTALVAAKVKLGYSRRKDLSLSAMDGWSQYIQAFIQGGADQNIHLTDILTTQLLTALQIHFGEPSSPGTHSASSRSFFSSEVENFCNILHSEWTRRDQSRRWIALQLGTANSQKSWAPEKWAKTAASIAKRHSEYRFVLLGTQADQARAQAFISCFEAEGLDSSWILNLTGQTDFDLWNAVVGGSHWLFSCDTAALHLASALGTRIFNVSVGPVRHQETGPYGTGHYVLAPKTPCGGCEDVSRQTPHSCHIDITPEAAYGAWTYAATEWSHQRKQSLEQHFSNLGWTAQLQRVKVLRSHVRDANDGGGVVYEALQQGPMELSDLSALVVEHVARHWYCGWAPPVGSGLRRDLLTPAVINALRGLHEPAQTLLEACQEAAKFSTLMAEKSKALKSDRLMSLKDKSDLHILSKNIHELDTLLHHLGDQHPVLSGFSKMARVLMHNLPGKKLWEIADESSRCYSQLAEGATLLNEWIEFSLRLAKPQAVAIRPLIHAAQEPQI